MKWSRLSRKTRYEKEPISWASSGEGKMKTRNWLIAFLLLFAVSACKEDQKSHSTFIDSTPKSFSWCDIDAVRDSLLREYEASLKTPIKHSLPILELEAKSVTYEDLAPIFEENCQPCHRPGGNTPFPLTSLKEIKRKRKTIKEVLFQRVMPPWMADIHYSNILDAPKITDEERAKIIWWLDHDMPSGDLTKVHSAYSPAKQKRADLYMQVAKPHVITENTDTYQCFLLDPKLKEDVFVEAISFESTNFYTIHHIMMYIDTAGILDTLPNDWNCMKDGIVEGLVPIDSWTKGQRMIKYSDDFAYRFPKKSKILLQTHYGDEALAGQLEQTTVGLYLRPEAPPREIQWQILNNLDISIPANTKKVESIEFCVEKDISVLGTIPHLHFIGRVVEIYAVNPACEKINLLKINDWDYLWTSRFMLPKPILVPNGSTIVMQIVYDNTDDNPNQPNDPIIDVVYDNYSVQEMMVLCVFYTDYEAGDENKIVGELVR